MSFALFYCQPAQHTFSFPFTMQSYLLVVPVLQGVILLVGTLFTVFGNCFPVKFVGSFCLTTDKASVLTPELPDIMRLFKIRQPVRSIVLCKNADTPCIHLMKLIFFWSSGNQRSYAFLQCSCRYSKTHELCQTHFQDSYR